MSSSEEEEQEDKEITEAASQDSFSKEGML